MSVSLTVNGQSNNQCSSVLVLKTLKVNITFNIRNYYNYKVKINLTCLYCNYPYSKSMLFDDETFRICCNNNCKKEFRAFIIKKKLKSVNDMGNRITKMICIV